MKKLLALVLAMTCALSVSVPAFAKSAEYTWDTVTADNMVDEDGKKIPGGDTIRPGDTVYYSFGSYSRYDYLLDKDMVKTDVDKDVGSKYISSAEIVTHKFGTSREVALKIVAKDNFTADEMKAKIDVYISAKKDLVGQPPFDGSFPSFKVGSGASTRSSSDIAALQKALDDRTAELADLKAELAVIDGTAKDSLIWLNDMKTTFTAWEAQKTDGPTGDTNYKWSELAGKVATATNAHTDAVAAVTENTQKITELTADIVKYEGDRDAAKGKLDVTLPGNTITVTFSVSGTDTAHVITSDLAEPDVDKWKVTTVGGQPATVGTNDTVALNPGLKDALLAIIGTDLTAYNAALTALAGGGTSLADQLVAENGKTKGLTDAEVAAKKTMEDWGGLKTADYNTALSKTSGSGYADLNAVNVKIGTQTARKSALGTATTGEIGTATTAVTTAKTALDNAVKDVGGLGYIKKGETMKVPMTMWIQNEKIEDDDFTFEAGTTGVVIKPLKNELNTVTYENNNGTLAVIEFTADSSSEYFMPRLSTKWNSNEDYDQYFEGADAYILSFDGNPYLPCTSRARVYIENPDEDRDINDFYAYEVVDGELIELDFENAESPETDEDAILIRTRRLGTYIFSDTPADIEDDDDYLPEDPPKVNIDQNTKPNPGTGF